MRLEVESIRQRIPRVMTNAFLDRREVNDLSAIIFKWWFCGRNRGTLVLGIA
jgi:hypothetical protein